MNGPTHLVVIDPQNSFVRPDGELSVAGAEEDTKRLAKFIRKNPRLLSKIHVTLDTHHLLDVAHPLFWIDSNRNHPAPFTPISVDDVKNGTWRPVNPAWTQRMIDYTQELADGGRYGLLIWPPHCLIGTPGHNVYEDLSAALLEWELRPEMVQYVTKGSNIFTEHYSAVKAEVPDPSDPHTQLNGGFINVLKQAGQVLITGQALSHCVAFTVRDIADNFGDEHISKLVLLEDTSSPVSSFESQAQDFVNEMKGRGMKVQKTTDF